MARLCSRGEWKVCGNGGKAAASVYLCGFSGLLCQGQKGGKEAACFFFFLREEGLRLQEEKRV